MKTLGYKPLVTKFTRLSQPQIALVCPACNSEIGLMEWIERRGYIGCVNCVK